jgi:hypothetical protein
VVYINWFLNKEGQIAWSRGANLLTRRLDVPQDHLAQYLLAKPRSNYWVSYYETDALRSVREETVLRELFGR